ncbi:MAG: ABC transporter ATP-binding protein [Bacteroidia bacterium]|nr:ABC transporter ATP-binding protein [Bacteroidia bacterium]
MSVIKLENISKQYRLGLVESKTIADDLSRFWAKVRGKEDPTLKIGVENKLDISNGEYIWALKDIDLEVKQGEVLGIIGKNGAGKSTLLKILSKVTTPTTGSVKIKGRIASLLEVGTGFHPELTGRENIFLNGAILGMTKAEIKNKFDEIVDFSGVERYIDTPVKRYSSGMYVRLAFAVAAHLDPEILIVDEVLAVGDAEFQKKALGKMQKVSKGQGRTVLFVSHNMNSLKHLCEKAILLEQGKIILTGDCNLIINKYIHETSYVNSFDKLNNLLFNIPKNDIIEISSIEIYQNQKIISDCIESGQDLKIIFKYSLLNREKGLRIFVDICNSEEYLILRSFHDEDNIGIPTMLQGDYISKCIIPANFLGPMDYVIIFNVGIHNERFVIPYNYLKIKLRVIHTGNYNKSYVNDTFRGLIGFTLNWETNINNTL